MKTTCMSCFALIVCVGMGFEKVAKFDEPPEAGYDLGFSQQNWRAAYELLDVKNAHLPGLASERAKALLILRLPSLATGSYSDRAVKDGDPIAVAIVRVLRQQETNVTALTVALQSAKRDPIAMQKMLDHQVGKGTVTVLTEDAFQKLTVKSGAMIARIAHKTTPDNERLEAFILSNALDVFAGIVPFFIILDEDSSELKIQVTQDSVRFRIASFRGDRLREFFRSEDPVTSQTYLLGIWGAVAGIRYP